MRDSKIVSINKKKKNINFGLITFVLIVLYLTISMLVFMFRDKISYYEVVYGKNASAVNKTYSALIVRDEKVVYANKSGYINYYVREGGRVSLNSYIYSVDENGTMLSIMNGITSSAEALNKDDIKNINKVISKFTTSFDNKKFYEIYDFKQNITSITDEYINLNILEKITNLDELKDSNLFSVYNPEMTGVVAFYTDGYESFDPYTISEKNFDRLNYNKKSFKSNEVITSGEAAYKVINDEEWYLYIKLDNDMYKKYKQATSINIKFVDKELYCNGGFSIITGTDGYYGKITLDKYMSTYITERFLDIKIIEDQISGLKIPKSAVVEKEFYVVPVSFLGKGGNNKNQGFFKEIFLEDGTVSVEFITPNIYAITDEYCYLSISDFNEGDRIVMNDSSSRYAIGPRGKLKGVYNINNGYCMFRLVDVLAESSDYYIVDDDTEYGLVVYDHIVLEGHMVKEDQVAFK